MDWWGSEQCLKMKKENKIKENSNEKYDWWDDISIEQKEAIKIGLNDLKSGNVHSDDEVRGFIREKLLSHRNHTFFFTNTPGFKIH